MKKKELAPAERAKFLATVRTKCLIVEEKSQQNGIARGRIISRLEESYAAVYNGYRDFKKASAVKTIPGLPELMFAAAMKVNYFASALSELESGLERQKQFEEKAISAMESALSAFRKGRSVGSFVKEVDNLHNSFFKREMDRRISEGEKFADKALSVKIPVENYLKALD